MHTHGSEDKKKYYNQDLLVCIIFKLQKKTLAFSTKLILSHFLQDIKSYIANQSIHISLISPSRVRKKILQQIFLHFKFTSSSILLEVDPVKCFNGCRPKKKRRKKRKGFRIFK